MPNIKPIPADTWDRLAALDRRCRISLWRDDQWLKAGVGGRMTWSGIGGPPAQWRRAWRVRIALAGSPLIVDIIDTAEPYLADALLAAITEAERRGYHERGSVPSPNGP